MTEGHRRRFTVWHAALLLPWLVISEVVTRPFTDNSYLWHVRAGDLQAATGAVLIRDPFSFTMEGEGWRTQSWLAELLYSWSDLRFGLDGGRIITLTCAVLVFVLLGLLVYRRSRSLITVAVYLAGSSILLGAFLNPRPAIFSFPLFSLLVVVDDHRRLEWCKPLIMWVWAAVHGSFVVGLVYLTLRAIARGFDQRERRSLLASGSVTLATAHGIGVIGILLDFFAGRGALALISEWQPPNLLEPSYVPLLLGLFVTVWLAQQGRINWRDWLLLVPFVTLAVSARRSVPLGWIGVAPIVGRFDLPIRASISSPILPVLLVVAIIGFPFFREPREQIDRARFPVEAAHHLTDERVFHDDVAGGWLIYDHWPDRQVYIDDRAELYQDQLREFVEARDVKGDWEAEFTKWEIDEALLRVDTPLAEVLKLSGWSVEYEGENFIVLKRSE